LETAQINSASKTAVELYAAGKKIADLEAENKELIRKIATLEHGTRVKDLQRQIDELNKAPVIHTRVQASGTTIVPTPAELDSGEFAAYSSMDME